PHHQVYPSQRRNRWRAGVGQPDALEPEYVSHDRHSAPTTTRSPTSSTPSTGVTWTKPSADTAVSTTTLRNVPSGSATSTIGRRSATAKPAATGTTSPAVSVRAATIVARTFAPAQRGSSGSLVVTTTSLRGGAPDVAGTTLVSATCPMTLVPSN